MDFFAVLDNLLEQLGALELMMLWLVVASVYVVAFRRRIRSPLDPLFYVLMFSGFTVVLLVVLLRLGVVTTAKFGFTVATLSLFYGGFLLTSRGRSRTLTTSTRCTQERVSVSALMLLFLINCALLGSTYIFFGIPLFLESRLSLWVGTGGFGAIGRLAGGLEFASLLIGLVACRRPGLQRRWGIALVLQFSIAAILSGSKGSLLSLLFAWYLCEVRRTGTWDVPIRLSKRSITIGAALLALPLLTIAIQAGPSGGGIGASLALYATRIAAEGDGYVYFFGNDLIDSIARTDYLALVRPMLAGLRLVPGETAVNPGFEVMSQILSGVDITAGPNSRLPIYLLYFYGSPGIVLAPLLGAALGLSRRVVAVSTGRSLYRYAVVTSIYLSCTKLEVDPQITVNGLFNLLLALPILWLVKQSGEAFHIRSSRRRLALLTPPMAGPQPR